MAAPSVELLRKIPLFAELDARELERLGGSFKERTFDAGSHVVDEGKTGAGFFVIESGEASVSVRGDERDKLGPGDYFGEIALLRDVPRTATVKATADTELLALERDDFLAAVTGHAASAEAAEAVVGARLGVSPV